MGFEHISSLHHDNDQIKEREENTNEYQMILNHSHDQENVKKGETNIRYKKRVNLSSPKDSISTCKVNSESSIGMHENDGDKFPSIGEQFHEQ